MSQTSTVACPTWLSLDTAHVPNTAKMKQTDKSSPVIEAVFI